MLLSSGLTTAPCGVPCSGVHSRAPSRTPLFEEARDQRQNEAVRHLLADQGLEAIFRDRVEVALQIGIDDWDVSGRRNSCLRRRRLASSSLAYCSTVT